MPFGRLGKVLSVIMMVAILNASMARHVLADTPQPQQQEQAGAGPSSLTEMELAQMRLAQEEAPYLQQFQGGFTVPLLVMIGLGVVACITFIYLVILPEKESPSTPDGYPHNTAAPEVSPERRVVAEKEAQDLQQQAQADAGLKNFAAGR